MEKGAREHGPLFRGEEKEEAWKRADQWCVGVALAMEMGWEIEEAAEGRRGAVSDDDDDEVVQKNRKHRSGEEGITRF